MNEQKTAVKKVMDFVEQGISNNSFAEGRLPAEPEIAATVGVSRTPVREAMKILDAIGISESRRGIGTCLNPQATTAIGYLMSFMTVTESATHQQLFEARLMVEQFAAGLIAHDLKSDDLVQIRAANEQLRKVADMPDPDLDAVTEADINFHRTIFDLCGNPLIAAIGKLTTEQVRPWIRVSHEKEGPMLSVQLHEIVIEAIAHDGSSNEKKSPLSQSVRNGLVSFRGRLPGE